MYTYTETNYPFYSYTPSHFGASVFAVLVCTSLLLWLTQSFRVRCRPIPLTIFIFVVHLASFIELVLRASLSTDRLKTATLYRVTAPLLSMPPRLLLMANYHCLVELRGKSPRRMLDRVIDIMVPVGGLSADILLTIANEFSLRANHINASFGFRQASAAIVLTLAILFYVVWYLAVPHPPRLYVLPLLAVSSTAVLIEAIYIQAISVPSTFVVLNRNELWFYIGHLIPIALALISWTGLHPSRSLPPRECDVQHNDSDTEIFPPVSSI